jgi:hypothetical protein
VRPITTVTITALLSLVAAGLAVGEQATPPETLVVGYENEGNAALQASYRAFIRALTFDRRLDWDEGAKTVPELVKTCMTHKSSLTTGGHNIRIDIISNEIAASCLTLISNLLRDETRQLTRR